LISLDTNLLIYALNSAAVEHKAAREFVNALEQDDNVAICELVLFELYGLLRNEKVFPNPAGPSEAVAVVQGFRLHPRWRLIDWPGQKPGLMDAVWTRAAAPGFARRRIFDVRLAAALQHHGVSEFATANEKDFLNLGFNRVWNPLRS
jgi:toxin-antitoxin system PIN domain toxin